MIVKLFERSKWKKGNIKPQRNEEGKKMKKAELKMKNKAKCAHKYVRLEKIRLRNYRKKYGRKEILIYSRQKILNSFQIFFLSNCVKIFHTK